MVAKDDLYQLIRSLTTSEKRYFKVFASRHTSAEEHNLNDLFDEIDRLDEYDEDKLKKRLSKKKENRSVVKYLSAEKKALQDLIMRAMRSYHGEKTVDVQLQELMTDELFYHGKSLYELQSKTLYKAKKLAEEYEKFPQLLTLLQREADMLIERKTKGFDDVLTRVLNEENIILEKILNEYNYRCIDNEFFLYYRTGANVRDKEFLNTIEKKIQTSLFESDRNALSFIAKRRFHKILNDYHRLKQNMQKAYEHSKKIIELYQEHPKHIQENITGYKIALSNYLGRCHLIQEYSDFEPIISKIKSIPTKSYNEDGEVFQNVYFYELLYYINNGRFEDAEKIIPEIEEGMIKYSAKINKARELTFYYNISILFFIRGKWKVALDWLNKIIDDKSDSRKDLQHFSRVLLLILNYELKRDDLLEFITRASYRYLFKEQRLHSFERIMLNYLKKLPFSMSQEHLMVSFKELKSEIELLYDNPNEKTSIGMEEMMYWLKSKIENRNMQEIVSETKI